MFNTPFSHLRISYGKLHMELILFSLKESQNVGRLGKNETY